MIEWLIVLGFIVIGIILLLIEIIFIPGTTIVGIFGGILVITGTYFGFSYFGEPTGWLILTGAGFASALATYFSFKSGAWNKFALKQSLDGKVNEGLLDQLGTGQLGVAISALNPVGKAEFENRQYEVTSLGSFIEQNTDIRIVKIKNHKIIVEQVNL